jgi:CRISPR-associated protein Cas2
MYVLITYDVSTASEGGERRLRQVAKVCEDYGQRVQNSVFECQLDPAQLVEIKAKLMAIINVEKDSLRFYNLGRNWHHRVDHVGAGEGYDIDGPLIV